MTSLPQLTAKLLTPKDWGTIERQCHWTGGRDVLAQDSAGRTALMAACQFAGTGLIGQLLHAGSDPDAEDHHGYSPLWHCSSPENLALLLDAGANPDQQEREGGNTLLHVWVECEDDERAMGFFSVLMERGASLRVSNVEGRTALDLARNHPTRETARLAVCMGEKDQLGHLPEAPMTGRGRRL